MPKSKGKFKCPSCEQRVRIEIVGGGWYWAVHDNRATGNRCALSGKQMA